MTVHEDFTSHKFTLVFDTGKRVKMDKEESEEFEKWYIDKEKAHRETQIALHQTPPTKAQGLRPLGFYRTGKEYENS